MSSGRNTLEETLYFTQLVPGGLTYVAFYDSGYENYIFANYYKNGPALVVNGYVYKTPEYYFQAQKFLEGSKEHQEIIGQPSADLARQKAAELFKNLSNSQKNAWYDSSYEAMVNVIRIRAQQDQVFRQLLLATGTNYILEDTYKGPGGKPDAKWGGGADGQGENLLGIALMQVRNEINPMNQDLMALTTLRAQARTERSQFPQIGVSFHSFAQGVTRLQPTPTTSSSVTQSANQPQQTSKTPLLGKSMFQPNVQNPFAGKDKPTEMISKMLSKHNISAVYLGNDKADPAKGVLKFQFHSIQDSNIFFNSLRKQNIHVVQDNNFIIMSLEGKGGNPPKAQQVLEALGIKFYGRSHPQPIINVLNDQWKYEQSQKSSHHYKF
ncbi:MAG: hypothetical protein ACD_46C00456G0006 [uncultured bacterium]|nr:MAG: hypothetical protein ACD_46C00456G0006 [uncultured bacterium]